MRPTSRRAAAVAATLLWIGSAVPAAAASNAASAGHVRPDALSDCGLYAGAPSASGGVVSFTVTVYCDTIVDSLQMQVTLTENTGGGAQPVASGFCSDSSTPGFSCTASAVCHSGSHYGGAVDAIETNSVGYTSEDGWNAAALWVPC